MQSKKKWLAWTVVILLLTNLTTWVVSGRMALFNLSTRTGLSVKDINEFSKMYLVKEALEKLYDGPMDENTLVEGAIKGMTNALNDPYTVFMNKKEYDTFSTQTSGSYAGVGIQIEVKDDKIVVVAPFDDSPAKKAGVAPGDIIAKVNGTQVSGKDLDKAVTMMKGAEGSEVTLTVERGNSNPFEIKMKRAKITLVSVKGEMIEKGIGYIQISSFDEHTGTEFNKKLQDLQEKGMKSLILDLRSNPGGLLDQCLEVVSNFIPKGKVVVSTIDKNKEETKYNSKGGMAIGLPLVVLTDGGTASASEIVSGAVRDYKIGTLIGEKTFGKGVVQTVLNTGDGTALKVTVSKYYTPSGENIHKIGIKPDIQVVYPESLRGKAYDRSTDPQFSKALEVAREKLK